MPFKCVVPGCRSNYYHVKGTQSVPMIRYPFDVGMREAWNEAICRPGFVPTPHSHVCIKHFRSDQLVPRAMDPPLPSDKFPISRRMMKLKKDAVPCLFDKDPSTHKLRRRPYTTVSPREGRKPSECVILAGAGAGGKVGKVEFKPEMWQEANKKIKELPVEPPTPIKRGRGRPRKQVLQVRPECRPPAKSDVVVSCCALACTNTSENFTMVSLPQEVASRKLWVEKIDRLDWSPEDDSSLCEVHFDEDAWDKNTVSGKALLPGAVPSLFLHGEAIKSWVTMDNTGNIADIVVDGRSTNDEDSNNCGSSHDNPEESMDCSDEDGSSIFVKREALEPEIDMVEGCEEDMVPRDSSAGEQFETIYCDSTFNDREDSENGLYEDKENDDISMTGTDLMEEENPLADERSSSPILQDGEVSCLEDSRKAKNSKYLVISMASKKLADDEKIIRRRSSSQLTDEFQCPICDRRLSRKKNLEIHMEKLHPFGEISEYLQKKKELSQFETKEDSTVKSKVYKKKPPPALKPLVPSCLLSPSAPVYPLKTPNVVATTSVPEGLLTTSFPILSFSSQSPQVSSSVETTPSTIVTPTLVASKSLINSTPLVTPTALIASPSLAPSSAGTLITTSSIVTTPCPMDPSPAGGEVRKQQFLLLLPKQTVIPTPPSLVKPSVPNQPKPPKLPNSEKPLATDESLYTINLGEMPLEKRLKLKAKLRELVDAVVTKNLNPEKIIIAYDRT